MKKGRKRGGMYGEGTHKCHAGNPKHHSNSRPKVMDSYSTQGSYNNWKRGE